MNAPTLIEDFKKKDIDEKGFFSALRKLGEVDHSFSVQYCLEGGDRRIMPAATVQAYEGLFPEKASSSLMRKAFTAFYSGQERTLQSGIKVNIFDFVMTSGTFDFPYGEQQSILNSFYGDLKPETDKSGLALPPFDPEDPNDCSRYREPRPLVDASDGSHCGTSTPKATALYSQGR
ncbi:MAG: hypothetical protein ACK5NY_03255 [Burkholderiaceae bacterium]